MIPTKETIFAIADSIYRASGMHVGIHDIQYTIEASAGDDSGNLCAYCRRCCPGFLETCLNDDAEHIAQAQKAKEPMVYRCHMGLTEAILPIRSEEDQVIGVVFLGQIRLIPDSTMTFDAVHAHLMSAYPASSYAIEREALLEAYNNTATMTREAFNGFLHLISLLVQGMYVSQWLNTREDTSESAFRRYLDTLDIVKIPLTAFSAQTAAAEMKLSYSQLNRLSNQILGMPLKQYILHEKIKAAADLLRNTDDPSVKNTAGAVGIDDAHYFSRLFKKYMGCSCSEYLQNLQNINRN